VVLVGVVLWLVLEQHPSGDEPLPVEPNAPAAPASPLNPGPAVNPAIEPATPESQRDTKPVDQAAPAAPSQPPTAPQQPENVAPIPAPKPSGPIAELKQAFEKEPRDSAAQAPESRIESEFRKSDIAPGLLKSVLCRKSVCKVEVVWTPDRAGAFMAAFTRLSAEFEPDIALDPHGPADAQEQLPVDVYLPRKGAAAKAPER
jgi:hypothetical protein